MASIALKAGPLLGYTVEQAEQAPVTVLEALDEVQASIKGQSGIPVENLVTAMRTRKSLNRGLNS